MDAANIRQFVSATPNNGSYMDFAWRAPRKPAARYHTNFDVVNGVIRAPETPRMGFVLDPGYLEAVRSGEELSAAEELLAHHNATFVAPHPPASAGASEYPATNGECARIARTISLCTPTPRP